MTLVLPTKPSEINKNWIDQKIGMIGAPGIGKSQFWSFGGKTLYIQTEAGLNHVSVMKLACRNFEELREIISALIQADQAKKFPYDTIVIDTIDELIDLVNEEVIRRGREKFMKVASDINSVGDIPNGAGWQWATELIKMTLDKLEKLPACICYVGHRSLVEVKSATDKFHKATISVGGKTGQSLLAWPDHVMNVEAIWSGEKLKRIVRTRPTQYIDAKSRGDVVPDGMIWSEDAKENYDKFRALFS